MFKTSSEIRMKLNMKDAFTVILRANRPTY